MDADVCDTQVITTQHKIIMDTDEMVCFSATEEERLDTHAKSNVRMR